MVGRIHFNLTGTVSLVNLGIDYILWNRDGYGHTYNFGMGRRTGSCFISRQDDFIYHIIFLYRTVPVTHNFEPYGNSTRIDNSFPRHRSNLCFSPGIIPDVIAIIDCFFVIYVELKKEIACPLEEL